MSESDYTAATLTAGPKHLAALLNSGTEGAKLWRPEELAAIFRHQLSAPVLLDLGGFDANSAARLKKLSDAQGLLLKSFSELFHHPMPPLALLELTKDFAKTNLDHPDSMLPTEIATALYYTSIAAAFVRLRIRISKLKDADLRKAFLWTKAQIWVDDWTKQLLTDALERIAPDAVGSA